MSECFLNQEEHKKEAGLSIHFWFLLQAEATRFWSHTGPQPCHLPDTAAQCRAHSPARSSRQPAGCSCPPASGLPSSAPLSSAGIAERRAHPCADPGMEPPGAGASRTGSGPPRTPGASENAAGTEGESHLRGHTGHVTGFPKVKCILRMRDHTDQHPQPQNESPCG